MGLVVTQAYILATQESEAKSLLALQREFKASLDTLARPSQRYKGTRDNSVLGHMC